jgi:GT2 family glycosyltransferase
VRADVVIPFRGSEAELRELLARAGDDVVVVDNRPPGAAAVADPRVVRAAGRQTSYYARNRGAERGSAPWIMFLDADVEPAADLLDRYLDPPPGDDVGVLAGAVRDAPAGPSAPMTARFAALSAPMDQAVTLRRGYAQTANCAVRRAAFEAVGGFTESVRSGGDADLCFRLRAAGWRLEERADAVVTHRNRDSLPALLRQRARHGAGAAWLDRRYPGSFPRALGPGTLAHSARELARAVRGDRDEAVLAGVGLLAHWAFELGRLLPNEVQSTKVR